MTTLIGPSPSPKTTPRGISYKMTRDRAIFPSHLHKYFTQSIIVQYAQDVNRRPFWVNGGDRHRQEVLSKLRKRSPDDSLIRQNK